MKKLISTSLLSVILLLNLSNSAIASEIIGYINNEPLYVEEYNEYIQLEKSSIHHLYANHLESGKHLYAQKINGINVGEHLKQLALQNAIKSKAELQYLKQLGMIANSDFKQLFFAMEKTNNERAIKHARGEVIYGPVRYNKKMYLSLLKANAINKLRESTDGQISLDALESYYAKHKTEQFSLMKTTALSWFNYQGKFKEPLLADKQAQHHGRHLNQLYFEVAQNNPEQLISHTFDARFSKLNETRYPRLFRAIQQKSLKPGQLFSLNTASNQHVVVKVISVEAQRYQPFQDVKHVIKRILFEQAYQHKITLLASQADININNDMLAKIRL